MDIWHEKTGLIVGGGEYIPTRKNRQVAEFYQTHGFDCLGEQSGGESEFFVFNLEVDLGPAPSLFKEIIVESAQERK